MNKTLTSRVSLGLWVSVSVTMARPRQEGLSNVPTNVGDMNKCVVLLTEVVAEECGRIGQSELGQMIC